MFPGPQDSTVAIRYKARHGSAQPAMDLLTYAEIEDLTHQRAYIAVHGIVTYDDIFGSHHWTKFCAWKSGSVGTYSAIKCADYNNVDDN